MSNNFDDKFKYFDKIKDDASFRSIWSIYEISSMYDLSNLEAESLVYKDHWGHNKAITVSLPNGNLKWWDLWYAADKAIIESDDEHHVFIEDFQKSPDGKTLFLRTGS